jgi:AcrR family transcriptional regulator
MWTGEPVDFEGSAPARLQVVTAESRAVRSNARARGLESEAVPSMPVTNRGLRTRAKLVDSARAVFEEHGYADTSIAALTAAAGISHGSFYSYFSSKEQLFREVAAAFGDRMYAEIRAGVDTKDPLLRLQEENRRYFEIFQQNSRMIRMVEEVSRDSPAFLEDRVKARRRVVGRVTRGMRRLQDEGRIDPTLNCRVASEALCGMVERMAVLCSLDDQLDPEGVQATLHQLWANAVQLRAPRPDTDTD